MRELVVIGNGPSVRGVDLAKVGEKYDTIGINGSFIEWMRTGWHPTYQYMGRKHPEQWGNQVVEFVKRFGNDMTVFASLTTYPEFEGLPGFQPMNFLSLPEFTPDSSKWSNTFEGDIELAFARLCDDVGVDRAKELVEERAEFTSVRMNEGGIYKTLIGDELTELDYISDDYPRYPNYYTLPKSFDEFYCDAEQSGMVACLIGMLLGYKKVNLIGCDNNFVIDKSGTMNQEKSYWVKDMFNGKPYYVAEDILCEECRNTMGLKLAMNALWEGLADSLKYNKIKMKIVNCSPISSVKAFPFGNLKLD